MEIDSHTEGIIADTALTEACKYQRRSKKWRKLIKLPHISECEELVEAYSAKDYDFIVRKQPIGRELFAMYCHKTSPLYSRCQSFLQAVREYELCQDIDQVDSANNILWSFLGFSQEGDTSISSPVNFTSYPEVCDNVKSSCSLLENRRHFIDLFSKE